MLNRGLARLVYNPKVKVSRSPELNIYMFYILAIFPRLCTITTFICKYEWSTYPRASFCGFSEKSFASRSRSLAYLASTWILRIKSTATYMFTNFYHQNFAKQILLLLIEHYRQHLLCIIEAEPLRAPQSNPWSRPLASSVLSSLTDGGVIVWLTKTKANIRRR